MKKQLNKAVKFYNRLICTLIGHKEGEYTDSGYEFCERCGEHQYYDSHSYYKQAYLFTPFFYIKYHTLKILEKITKKLVRNKTDDLPF
jgi:hypothetical protein